MVVKTLTSPILAFFSTFEPYRHYSGFLTSVARKPPFGFNNKLLEVFYWPWNGFELFIITNINFFLIKS